MKATAPGKVMLIGEYIALEGYPSLLVAVDRYAEASTGQQQIVPGKKSWQVEKPLPELAGVNALCEKLKLSGWYTVDTSSFLNQEGIKLGLGSSAAAIVALAALVAPQMPLLQRFLLARDTHATSQKEIGSGADVATSTFGGFLLYRKAPLVYTHIAAEQIQVELLCFETGLAASTTDLVKAVSSQRRTPTVERLFGAMSEASEAAISALRAKDSARVILWFGQYGRLVRSLGEAVGAELWLPIHSKADEIAKTFGGCAKPTGAGGGDLVLVAVPKENANAAKEALVQSGLRFVELRLSLQGAQRNSVKPQTAPLVL
jgi:phosphomevalonate kinase